MKQNNLHHIVYTGFHDGCCILHQEFTGAKYMSKIYSCYMKQDLICYVPELFVDTTIDHNGKSSGTFTRFKLEV